MARGTHQTLCTLPNARSHDPMTPHQARGNSARMQPFPPSAALQCFVGDAIAQVSLDPYGVQFSFESMRRLVAELRIEQIELDGTVWPYECEAAEGPPLIVHRLLYRRIVAVERGPAAHFQD